MRHISRSAMEQLVWPCGGRLQEKNAALKLRSVRQILSLDEYYAWLGFVLSTSFYAYAVL